MAAMSAAVYFLMAISAGDAPAMTTMASFGDADACRTAAAAMTAAAETGTGAARFACFPSDALDAMGKSRL